MQLVACWITQKTKLTKRMKVYLYESVKGDAHETDNDSVGQSHDDRDRLESVKAFVSTSDQERRCRRPFSQRPEHTLNKTEV